MTNKPSPLGLIAGRGELPLQLARHCRDSGRPCFVVGIADETDMELYADFPQEVIKLGQIGRAMQCFKEFGAKELVMAGPIHRPKLRNIRTDATGAKLLAKLLAAKFLGDDKLLSIVIQWIEQQGFKVIGPDDVLGELRAPAGVLGRHAPGEQDRTDIALGVKVLQTLSPLDVGQAVVVRRGYVLGIEAAEGTEALIARCGEYSGRDGGVLVKLSKTGQDTRADLPTIGPDTVEQLAAAGMRGMAVQANGALMLEQEQLCGQADEAGIFVIGIDPKDFTS